MVRWVCLACLLNCGVNVLCVCLRSTLGHYLLPCIAFGSIWALDFLTLGLSHIFLMPQNCVMESAMLLPVESALGSEECVGSVALARDDLCHAYEVYYPRPLPLRLIRAAVDIRCAHRRQMLRRHAAAHAWDEVVAIGTRLCTLFFVRHPPKRVCNSIYVTR